jgi:hypothetical protein
MFTVALDTSGILYVLVIKLEDKELVKIGVTQRDKVEDRVAEILISIWKRYRVFPECYPKRFRKVDNVYDRESIMHKKFSEYKYSTKHKFSGSTEMFDVDILEVVEAYEQLLSAGEADVQDN